MLSLLLISVELKSNHLRTYVYKNSFFLKYVYLHIFWGNVWLPYSSLCRWKENPCFIFLENLRLWVIIPVMWCSEREKERSRNPFIFTISDI